MTKTKPDIIRRRKKKAPPAPVVHDDDESSNTRLAGIQAVIDAAARARGPQRVELLRMAVRELTAVLQSDADRYTVAALEGR